MPNQRSRAVCLILVATSFAWSGSARAESPLAECLSDADCGAGGQCARSSCIPPELICTTSSDCPESYVCGYAAWNCPTEGAEEACPTGTRGRCEPPLEHPCSMDAQCSADELCYPIARPTCAAGDGACAARPPGACFDWAIVCPDRACAASFSCVDHRCVSEDGADEAAEIVIDESKTARLHEVWKRGPPGGCSVSAGGRPMPAWLLCALCVAAGGLATARQPRALRRSPPRRGAGPRRVRPR